MNRGELVNPAGNPANICLEKIGASAQLSCPYGKMKTPSF